VRSGRGHGQVRKRGGDNLRERVKGIKERYCWSNAIRREDTMVSRITILYNPVLFYTIQSHTTRFTQIQYSTIQFYIMQHDPAQL
jgi:hypothetical protein